MAEAQPAADTAKTDAEHSSTDAASTTNEAKEDGEDLPIEDQSESTPEDVADLRKQVAKLTSKLEKQNKNAKKTSKTAKGAGKKEKKEKKSAKKQVIAAKERKAEKAAATAAEAAKAKRKAEKKALKAAEAAAEAAAAAKKEKKAAKKAKAEYSAALTSGSSKANKNKKKKRTREKTTAKTAAIVEAATKSETSSASNNKSSKKTAKTLSNGSSLTWTSDSSVDILAGQNFCFPIELADSRPSTLEWTFQTAGGDISFSISYSPKTGKGKKKKKTVEIFPEARVDSYCDEHIQTDAFNGVVNHEKALATALERFYEKCDIVKEPKSTARAAKIFIKRQEEMLSHLQTKYLKNPDLSKADSSIRKKAFHQLKKDLHRPAHLIHLEQGGCFKIIGSVDINGPGTIRLTWDNSFSWLRSKQLIFSVKLRARTPSGSKKSK